RALPRRDGARSQRPESLAQARALGAAPSRQPFHAGQLTAHGRQRDLVVDEVHRRVVAKVLDLPRLDLVLEGALELGAAGRAGLDEKLERIASRAQRQRLPAGALRAVEEDELGE